jgi:hypothetical protein
MAKGSCLCGKITYAAITVGPNVTKCHCKICQKTSGSAYGDYTTAPIDSFKWTSGEALLTKYESSPGNSRNSGIAFELARLAPLRAHGLDVGIGGMKGVDIVPVPSAS